MNCVTKKCNMCGFIMSSGYHKKGTRSYPSNSYFFCIECGTDYYYQNSKIINESFYVRYYKVINDYENNKTQVFNEKAELVVNSKLAKNLLSINQFSKISENLNKILIFK